MISFETSTSRFYKAIAIASLVSLAACSSVSEIRETRALIDVSSSRSARIVAECIRDGWQATPLVGGSVGGILQQSGEKYSVVAPNTESPWHVVDVSPAGSGSAIRYHFYRTWQSPPEKVTSVVKVCSS